MIRSLATLLRLQRDQWRRPSELARIQARRLRRMVRHSYDQVPFYRRRLDEAGLDPARIKGLADLRNLPPVSRSELQDRSPYDLLASGVDPARCKQLTTAGSSGAPLTVVFSKTDDWFKDLVWARTSLANGRGIRDLTVYFKFQSAPPRGFERLGIWPRLTLSVLDPPEERIKAMRRADVKIVRANAFELVNMADVMLDSGVEDIRPKAVFSMGSLLDTNARERISRAFGCPVFDCYGATELGCIAWECSRHSGLHINMDTVGVEFLHGDEPARPGQLARLVCTSLFSLTMPFIRYDIGDIGVLDPAPCPCGRGLPLMSRLEGRADDFFIRTDGRWISPSEVVNRLKRLPGLARFRLVQKTPSLVDLWVVPTQGHSELSSEESVTILRDILGKHLQVRFHVVDQLPPDPGRKIRSMISEVPREHPA